jgi:hypothetical protein
MILKLYYKNQSDHIYPIHELTGGAPRHKNIVNFISVCLELERLLLIDKIRQVS